MTKPAAFYGSYVDAKFMPGLKVMRVMVDVPIEKSNAFLAAFGAPDRADPVPVAIARLVTPPAEPLTAPKRGEAQDEDKPRTPFRELKPVKQVGIRCADPEFQKWISRALPIEWGESVTLGIDDPEDRAAHVVRAVCLVGSRADIVEGDKSNDLWMALLTDFETRGYAR